MTDNKGKKKYRKDEYLSTHQFSELTGIPVKRLHYFDERGILKPAKREGGKDNNYRKYSPMQITTAKTSQILRETGVLLDEIAELERNRSPQIISNILAMKTDSLEFLIQEIKDVIKITNSYREMINEGINVDTSKIYVRTLPEMPITLGDLTTFTEEEGFINDFIEFCMKPRNPEMNLHYSIGGYFESMDSFLQHPSIPDRFYSLDPDGGTIRERGKYLIGYTRGYYGTTNDLPKRMYEYAQEHKLDFRGPVYNIFIQDELCITNPDDYLLQVSASIKYPSNKFPRNMLKQSDRENTGL